MTQQLQHCSHFTIQLLLGTIQCNILQVRGFYLLEKFISSLLGLGLVLMNFHSEQNIGNLNDDLYYIIKK